MFGKLPDHWPTSTLRGRPFFSLFLSKADPSNPCLMSACSQCMRVLNLATVAVMDFGDQDLPELYLHALCPILFCSRPRKVGT